jgi:type III secretion protein C
MFFGVCSGPQRTSFGNRIPASSTRASLRSIVAALLLASVEPAFASGPVQVAEAAIPWTVSAFHYRRTGSDVADALVVLSAVEHIPIVDTGATRCTIDASYEQTPQRFLENIARLCQLDWYYDGATLGISEKSNRRSLEIRLNFADAADLDAALVNHHLKVDRFRASYDKPHKLLSVQGPARYVASLAAVARLVESRRAAQTHTAVRLVRLRYATAADDRGLTNDPGLSGPGVASRLNARDNSKGEQVVEYEVGLPVFSADASTNSVLVRDIPSRLDADVQRILELDHPSSDISVEVTIADVSTGALAALSGENILARFELPAEPESDNKEGVLLAVVGQRGSAVLNALTQWAAAGTARIELARTFLTQDGNAVMASRTAVVNARQDAGNGPLKPGQDDFSLGIRPTIIANKAQSKIDLCVYIDHLLFDALEHSHASVPCLPVPGTFDMPREVLEAGQALILTRLQDGSAQTRLVVIVPQVRVGIVGQSLRVRFPAACGVSCGK